MNVQPIEDGDARGFRWGDDGTPYLFREGDDKGMSLAFRKAVRDGVLKGQTPDDGVAREMAKAMASRLGIRKDAGGDLILAWWLPQDLAESLALPSGVAASDMHLTVLYLGDPEKYDLDLVAAVAKISTVWKAPMQGLVGGLGRFVGEEDMDVIVALVDCPDLECWRDQLCDELMMRGVMLDDDARSHGYVPHITLGYFDRSQASPPPYTETIPFTIDNLTVAAGATRVSYELEGGKDVLESEPTAYYASRATKEAGDIAKAGRVLSAKNLKALTEMRDALDKVLANAETKEKKEDDDDKGSGYRKRAPGGEGAEDDVSPDESDGEASEALAYSVTKANEEERYTLGPLYAPNRKDAHGEWTDAETLQKAVWEYVRVSADEGRRLHLQHDTFGEDVTVGEWVEIITWPYETEVEIAKADGTTKSVTLPANTVYMGVVWDEDSWEDVKSGKLGGYSLGGKAVRVTTPGVNLQSMGGE